MTKTIAHELAKKQKEISIAEFFERNKHILGFGNPTRALVTAVKEAVDNSLDACEEARILPDILVEIHTKGEDGECKIIVEDNGPGIIKRQIPLVFGKLLYGSRFHAIRQSRGQQGIGISAVVLYGQLSTGKHTLVLSKIGEKQPAHLYELAIDTNKNTPEIVKNEIVTWEKEHGTRIEITIHGDYKRGRHFLYDYLQSTSIVNPHAQITFVEPNGDKHLFERVTDTLPAPTIELKKPHPQGIELGTLIKMAKHTSNRKLSTFLKKEFTSMGERTTNAVCRIAGLDKDANPKELTREEFIRLHKAFKKVKIMAPPTDCLSPIGETLIKRSLKHETREISPEFIVATTRPPSVYSGHPFQVEVGIVYGGKLDPNSPVKILRFANRVPLLYQQGGCVSTAALSDIDWRRYKLEQRGGKGIPTGPAIFFIHVASTSVPFTSESKEAIADVPEIENEIKLALRECARRMQSHLTKKERRKKTREKFELITKILPEIAKKSASMLEKPVPSLDAVITKIMDVVWIEDIITYEKVERRDQQTTLDKFDDDKGHGYITKSRLIIANYKQKPQKFNLYALIPSDAIVGYVDPKPEKIEEGRYIKWCLPTIPPTSKLDVTFELAGLDKGDFDENDLYVEGINPEYVIGANKWEGE
ncbi:MAG: DNA topoisomerase VI subunit B [Thermoplasmata archaeon]|nr:MAG: DNA topoisomerase VI subunit B [Thermoplasmata archaeon]